MNESVKFPRRFTSPPPRFVRALVAAVLVAALAFEMLPWGVVESAPAAAGAASEYAFRLEPLQVCDHGDGFVGVLFDLPIILPGAPSLFMSAGTRQFVHATIASRPDGYLSSIDHPPQLSA